MSDEPTRDPLESQSDEPENLGFVTPPQEETSEGLTIDFDADTDPAPALELAGDEPSQRGGDDEALVLNLDDEAASSPASGETPGGLELASQAHDEPQPIAFDAPQPPALELGDATPVHDVGASGEAFGAPQAPPAGTFAQETPGTSAGLPPEPPAGNGPINRPAEGAVQKLPGEVFTESFQGSESAGDFLGLDVEFAGAGYGLPHDGSGAAAAPPPANLELTPAPTVESATEVQDYDAEYDLEGPTHIMHVDDGEGHEEYAEDGEYLDDGYDEEGFLEEEGAPRSRRGLVVGAFALGLVAVVGVTVVPDLLNDRAQPAPTVARNTPPAPGATTSAQPVDPVAPADPADPAVDPTAGTETTLDGTEAGTDPEIAGGPEPRVDPGVETFLTADPMPTPTPTNEVAGVETGDEGFGTDLLSGLAIPEDVQAGAAGTPEAGSDETFPDFASGFEWVSEDKLDMIWRGETVPMEAIAAPAKTVMPRVGDVRVHTKPGEILEGRLYAVGQNRIWIDIEGGRLGLDSETVERIERVDVDPVMQGSGPLVGARVRVELPGGPLTGHVAAQKGDVLTLVTPEGGNVMVTDAQVSSVGNGRAVVVRN